MLHHQRRRVVTDKTKVIYYRAFYSQCLPTSIYGTELIYSLDQRREAAVVMIHIFQMSWRWSVTWAPLQSCGVEESVLKLLQQENEGHCCNMLESTL